MSKICIGIPSLGINEKYFDQKLEEHNKFGIDFIIYVNYRCSDKVSPIPEKYKVPGFKVIQELNAFSMGNFLARYNLMTHFLKSEYDYLFTFDIDDDLINMNEDELLKDLGDLDYTKYKFDNVNIDSFESTNFDELLKKKFVVGIHNCLLTKNLIIKLLCMLSPYKTNYFNFGEDILFTISILNLINKYKVSNIVTAHYDDSGASFSYGKALDVSESIINLFKNIIPSINFSLSKNLIEYIFLSNFSYILYEYYQRFKKEIGGT